jgi:hypothetical protein
MKKSEFERIVREIVEEELQYIQEADDKAQQVIQKLKDMMSNRQKLEKTAGKNKEHYKQLVAIDREFHRLADVLGKKAIETVLGKGQLEKNLAYWKDLD